MRTVLCAVALAAMAAPLQAQPQDQHDMCMQDAHCRAATEAELDELRGGFDIHTGGGRLRIDIGITRQVSINDRVVAVSQLMLPDLGQWFRNGRHGGSQNSNAGPIFVNHTPVTNGPVVLNDGGALIVQNGPNNTAPLPSQFGLQAIPTIVQNTLDNQKINTLTLVNARVNSLPMLNTLRLGDMMNRATAASGR